MLDLLCLTFVVLALACVALTVAVPAVGTAGCVWCCVVAARLGDLRRA